MNMTSWFVAPIAVLSIGLGGCGGIDERESRYREVSLSDHEAATRIRLIDENYSPPRTQEKVAASLAVAFQSISPKTREDVLWRGSRACVWLAEYMDTKNARRQAAVEGAHFGREATAKNPQRVEPYFYYALSLGMLSQIDSTSQHVDRMAELCERAIEIDESFEHAGPHRFLGLLYYETEGYVTASIGSLDDALSHLKRACEIAPNYPLNHLAYGQALMEDDQERKARHHFQRVLELKPPAGSNDPYQQWQEDARKLLQELGA